MKSEPAVLPRMYHAVMVRFVTRWALFTPTSEPGIRALVDFVTFFGLSRYRERLAPDYLLRVAELSRDLPGALERLGQSSPFWRMSPPQ